MRFLNMTLRELFQGRKKQTEPDNFNLPSLSPWKGRKAIVFQILTECWDGKLTYRQIQLLVKNRTGVACSKALIAEWKAENMPKYPTNPPPPSPRTGKEKPKRPYKP